MSKTTITVALFLSTLPTLLTSPSVLAKNNKLSFIKSQHNTEHKITGKLLYLNDKKGDVDLLIQGGNRFSYYQQIAKNGLTQKAQLIEIPKNAQFFNQAKLANQAYDVIVYLTADAVMSYHIASKTLTKLLAVDTLFKYQNTAKTDFSGVSFGEFVQDFNQDGLSDFITTSLDKTHVYLQNSDGTFNHQDFSIAPQIKKSANGLLFTPYNFYHADFNQDNKKDIAFQIDDQLSVYTQNKDKSFNAKPISLALNAHLENKNSLIKKAPDKKRATVKLETIDDINGDGLVDIVTKESIRDGMMSSTNVLQVRYGFMNNGIMHYHKEADGKASFDGEGMIKFKDVNGNGLKEYYTLSVEMGLGTMMSAMSGSVNMDLRFYTLGKDGKYVKKPRYKNEVEIAVNSGTDSDVLTDIEDFNGDGINDLILKTDDDEFTIYAGTTNKRLFAKRGTDYDISLPKSVRTEVKDFNDDGKADILFLYSKYYDDDEKKEVGENKLTLWLSAG